MTQRIAPLLLLLTLTLTLLVVSCSPSRTVVREVPINIVDTTVMQPLTIEGDSSALRLAIECLSTGPRVTSVESAGGRPLLSWSWDHEGLLRISGVTPPREILRPVRTITREVPVEVLREVPRALRWYERGLMLLGLVTLLSYLYSLARLLTEMARRARG